MPEDVAEATRRRSSPNTSTGRLRRSRRDTRLDELGVNSLQLIEIIMDLEDMFDIEFSENTAEAWATLKTVDDVTQAVEAMIAKKA